MATADPPHTDPLASIVDEARAAIAAGEIPNREALAARIRALSAGGQDTDRALQRLDRVLSVQRARALMSRQPAAPAPTSAAPRPLRAALRTRPTLTSNMDVRRQTNGATYSLVWDAAPGATEWEVRLSERPDPRGEYVPLETRTLPGDATSIDLPLTEHALRVHLLGRGRGGKLLRRAVISGLSLDSWNERWQRRASAS